MSNEGGDIYKWAKDGTSVPEDAAKPNIIPSKAGPQDTSAGGLGAASLIGAASNPILAEGAVASDNAITASGHEIPVSTESKHSRSGGKERPKGA